MSKVFKFDQSEGAEIIAADNAKEAIMFYFTQYMDDIQTDDICFSGGIKITELTGEDLHKKHTIFDEEVNERVEVTYRKLADEYYSGEPVVLISPNY